MWLTTGAIGAPVRPAGKPVHVAVMAGRDQTFQPRAAMRNGIGGGNAKGVEALRARGLNKRGFQGYGLQSCGQGSAIAQKSRSA